MKSLTYLALISILFFGCKTKEDIAREQMVTNLNLQIQDHGKLSADTTVRMQNLEERISKMTGKFEETSHETNQTFEQRIKTLEERLILMEETSKARSEQITLLTTKMDGQSKYIKEVLNTLNKISGKSGKKGKKKKFQSPYWAAMGAYKDGKYKKALPMLLALLEKKKVKGSRKARTIHNIGMCNFLSKDYDNAKVYFSRLFSEYPKSNYNKNGLLFLGKSLQKLKENEIAKMTLNQLIERFPKAKQVKEAKKIISKL